MTSVSKCNRTDQGLVTLNTRPFLLHLLGCQERTQLNDTSYSASTAVQPARFAKLDTSNPSASRRAWCRERNDIGGYLQIDLGKNSLKPCCHRTENDGDWYIYPQFLAQENPKTPYKNAQKSSENFKPCRHNVVNSGKNFAKLWLSMCAYWLC